MKNTYYIWNPIFLLSLAALLLNDFIWKTEYPGVFTGKLSDFSGLAVFVLFFSALTESKFRTLLYLTTAFVFAWWKSSFSESFIHSWNDTISFYPLQRTIDYTDLYCLTVLVPLYFYSPKFKPGLVPAKYFTLPLLFLGFFAITATSKAKSLSTTDGLRQCWIDQSFKLKMTKAEFLHAISLSNITIEKNPEIPTVKSNGYASYFLKNFTFDQFTVEVMNIGLKEKGKKLIVYIGEVRLIAPTDRTSKEIRNEITSRTKELFSRQISQSK